MHNPYTHPIYGPACARDMEQRKPQTPAARPRSNPEGIATPSPGLRPRRYPGFTAQKESPNPNGVAAHSRTSRFSIRE